MGSSPIPTTIDGELAERFKAAVLKTDERKFRRFESCTLRNLAPVAQLDRASAF